MTEPTNTAPTTTAPTTTTIFEYAGGAPAWQRLAEAQYRRCLTDPVLIELFGTEGRPGHADHLAAWLGEVFGGPDRYTRELGGHGALLRHHANLAITQPQRERFIESFLAAADEVGLPDDDRFRGRFRAYLDWGTAIAVAVSQPGADTSSDQPVPHWGWEAGR
jgi:hemoglobin